MSVVPCSQKSAVIKYKVQYLDTKLPLSSSINYMTWFKITKLDAKNTYDKELRPIFKTKMSV